MMNHPFRSKVSFPHWFRSLAGQANFLNPRIPTLPLAVVLLPLLVFSLPLGAQSRLPKDPLKISTFVFAGTVKKLQAATEGIPSESRTAVVRVDEILEGAKTVGNFTGQEVTLRLVAGETLAEGEDRKSTRL